MGFRAPCKIRFKRQTSQFARPLRKKNVTLINSLYFITKEYTVEKIMRVKIECKVKCKTAAFFQKKVKALNLIILLNSDWSEVVSGTAALTVVHFHINVIARSPATSYNALF